MLRFLVLFCFFPVVSSAEIIDIFYEGEVWILQVGESEYCFPPTFHKQGEGDNHITFSTMEDVSDRIILHWGKSFVDKHISDIQEAYEIRDSGNIGAYKFLDLALDQSFGFSLFVTHVELPKVGIVEIGTVQDKATSIANSIFSSIFCK